VNLFRLTISIIDSILTPKQKRKRIKIPNLYNVKTARKSLLKQSIKEKNLYLFVLIVGLITKRIRMNQINNRLKKVIYYKLDEDLKNFIVHPYGNEIWLIDKENKSWFLQIESKGDLWFNQKYFNTFFALFSMGSSEYSKILKEWTEKVLDIKLKTCSRKNTNYEYLIEGVLSESVKEYKWDENKRFGFSYSTVKRYFDLKNKSETKLVVLNEYLYKAKLSPQPQVLEALGLTHSKPLPFNPSE